MKIPVSKSILILIGAMVSLSIFLYESASHSNDEIFDLNKMAPVAEAKVTSLLDVDGKNHIDLISKYSNSQAAMIPLTEDEKLNIYKLMKHYQSAMPGQPLVLVEKYLLDYININLPADKVDEAIKLTSNLIEFQNSLKEIENNYKNINFSESEGIKWLAKLKFDLRETFVQKDGISLYVTTE